MGRKCKTAIKVRSTPRQRNRNSPAAPRSSEPDQDGAVPTPDLIANAALTEDIPGASAASTTPLLPAASSANEPAPSATVLTDATASDTHRRPKLLAKRTKAATTSGTFPETAKPAAKRPTLRQTVGKEQENGGPSPPPVSIQGQVETVVPPEAGPRPSQAGRVLLVDPLGKWQDQEVGLLLAIRDHAPWVQIRSLTPFRHGFRLAVSDTAAFKAAVATAAPFRYCTAEDPTRPPRPMEVTLHVPAKIPTARILEDLREQLGDDVRAVRRLHAITNGRVDPDRPLPRVVVAVLGEATAARVSTARLFGVLTPTGATPRGVVQPKLCPRCFRWGHGAAACRQDRRCIRCGSTDHLSTACTTPREETRCLGCKGKHAANWGGCPLRFQAARDLERAHKAATAPQLAQPTLRKPAGQRQQQHFTDPGLTFAAAVRQPDLGSSDDTTGPTTEATPVDSTCSPTDQAPTTPPSEATDLPEQISCGSLRKQEMKDIATQLLEVRRLLDVANTARRDAQQEHACLHNQRTKKEVNRANRRCTALRKRLQKLHEQQQSIRGLSLAQATAEIPQRPPPPPPPAEPLSGMAPHPPAPQQGGAAPDPAQPGEHPAVTLTRQLRILSGLASDPAAALTAMDAGLRSLEVLLAVCLPHV